MPSIRIGFSTDFNLTSEQVGIGTTLPTARLDVRGQILSDNAAGGGGISTLTEYQGFLHSKQGIGNTVSIAQTTKGNLNSLSGEIVISGEVTVEDDTPLTGGRLDSLTVTGKFDLPHGGSEDREETPEKGSTRFNQDLGQLEFYTGYEWRTVGSIDGSGRGRGVFGGGYGTPGNNNKNSEFINIMSLGNALSFGDLVLNAKYSQSGASDGKRGLFIGGQSVSDIEYITIASEGNSIDFGDLTGSTGNHCGSLSSSTRAIRGGGYSGPGPVGINVMDYVQIQTLGNALDFGDLLEGNFGLCGFSNSTRGIFAGGRGVDAPSGQTRINQITIASTGNAISFGNLTERNSYVAGLSNSIRGFICGGSNPITNTIQYLTIATSGNTEDFGDLTLAKNGIASGNSANQVRGVFAGGSNSPTGGFNVIDYITIATKGNAQDFGDLSILRAYSGALSDSHGGLGGF